LGHLPFAFALIPDASVTLILYVIAGNSFFWFDRRVPLLEEGP
jgi:hypothetical protein